MIKFGVAGNSESFYSEGFSHTEQVPPWLKERGLDIFEYSFGRGVRISEPTAEKIKNAFCESGIDISVHAPYYINFSNPDRDKIEGSFGYVLDSLKAVKLFGGTRVVCHPGAQQKQDRKVAVDNAISSLTELKSIKKEMGFDDFIVCLETMGKIGQIGTVDEVIAFCNLDDTYYPCIDFGHINAREKGILKTEEDFDYLLKRFIDGIGYEKTRDMHAHFSKIEYSNGGEVRHLTFADTTFGPEFLPLAKALIKNKLEPIIICESAGTQAEDSSNMKKIYFDELKRG